MSTGQTTEDDVETVRCCPDSECESARISLHTSSAARARHEDIARWRCTECGHEFDDPDTRPSRGVYRGPTSPEGLALRDADPDDVLPDGGQTVDACPREDCQSSNLRVRNPSSPSSNPETTHRYRCKDCGHEFDDPIEREAQAAQDITTPGHAAAAAAADPDDVLPDGGTMRVQSLQEVSCPNCLFAEGTAAVGPNVCRDCGEWFQVTSDGRVHPSRSPRRERTRRASAEGGRW